jgi:hypothetical protein
LFSALANQHQIKPADHHPNKPPQPIFANFSFSFSRKQPNKRT